MVGIVAVTRFCESGSKAFSTYIDYIDRNEAVRKDNVERFNIFEGYTDYMDDETKTIQEEGKNLESVSALFTRDKDSLSTTDKKGLKDVFKKAQNSGSNMWQTVVSFDNSYLTELGIYDPVSDLLNEKLLRQAGRKAINEMLKSEGLENATWAASFHRNTDNIHIHIATVEPIPMREKKSYILYERDSEGKLPRDENGKIVKVPVKDEKGNIVEYEGYKGTFKKKSIDTLKSVLRSELEDNKETYTEITRLVRESILEDKYNKSLLDNPVFTEKMQDLYEELRNSGVPRKNWNYNQNQIKEIRPLINDLSGFFIDTYHREDFANFVSEIEKEAARQTKAYGGKTNNYVENQLYGKEGIYARLGNAILRELKTYDKNINDKIGQVKDIEKYLTKDGDEYNPGRAIKELNILSDQGNTYAQNRLGLIYLRGEGVKKDSIKAKEYFLRSSNNGDSFGTKMVNSISQGRVSKSSHIHIQKVYNSHPGGSIRRGLRLLESELSRNYESARNIAEAEELQKEIERRGEEL